MIKNYYINHSGLSARRGYTLVEALIYIAVFVSLSFVIIFLIMSVLEIGRQVSPLNALSRTAISSFEAITREIRSGKNVDIPNSILGASPGSLQLISLDEAGNSQIVKFYLESDQVKIDRDGVYLGPLSSSDVRVTALSFSLATSSAQDLIKIKLSLTAGSGKYEKSEDFYSSVKFRLDN